mgnify:CR=1 FL=1
MVNGKKDKTPWCFIDYGTTEALIEAMRNKEPLYEHCNMTDIPACTDSALDICPGSYAGPLSTTINNYHCKCWSDVSLSIRPSDQKDEPLPSDTHNYCR